MPDPPLSSDVRAHVLSDLLPLLVPLSDLDLDPNNARVHSIDNLAALTASLQRFGQRKPIVAQRNELGRLVVRAGNATVTVAQNLGWTHVAAVVVTESDAAASAFAIADNRTAELAQWDEVRLADIVRDLPADLVASTGFSVDDFSFDEVDKIDGNVLTAEPQAEAPVSRKFWFTVSGPLEAQPRAVAELVALLSKHPQLEVKSGVHEVAPKPPAPL